MHSHTDGLVQEMTGRNIASMGMGKGGNAHLNHSTLLNVIGMHSINNCKDFGSISHA